MSDEDLSKLVHRGVEEAFFKERTVQDGSWSTKQIPPLLHELVRSILSVKVEALLKAWMDSHQEEVVKAVESAIQQGMAQALIKSVQDLFYQDLSKLRQSMSESIAQGLRPY